MLDALKVTDVASVASLTKKSFLRYDKSKDDVKLHIGLTEPANFEALKKISDSQLINTKKGEEIVITLPKNSFVAEVVNTISSRQNSFWSDSPLLKNIAKHKVLVEFRYIKEQVIFVQINIAAQFQFSKYCQAFPHGSLSINNHRQFCIKHHVKRWPQHRENQLPRGLGHSVRFT